MHDFNEITTRYNNEKPSQWEGIKRNQVTLVLCPANLPEKWQSEAEATIKDSFARIVKTVSDVREFMEEFDKKLEAGESPRAVMIFTYEWVKLAEKREHAYQIYHGKDGYQRRYDSANGKYVYSHLEQVIDPRTGPAQVRKRYSRNSYDFPRSSIACVFQPSAEERMSRRDGPGAH